MKLYFSPSACSLVVRIILNELNRPFDQEAVDLKSKKTKGGKDYWAINPKGAVPALLLDEGSVLTENQVILQYLADTTPGQTVLKPVGDLQRYQTLSWLNYVATELHKSIGMFFNPALTEEMKNKVLNPLIAQKFTFINQHLKNNTYFMGDTLTLPDAYLFVMLIWSYHLKIDLSSYGNLEKFYQNMKTRKAVKLSLEQEELKIT